MPTYCLDGKNLIGVGAFKNHVALWFHQGVFLNDPKRVLTNTQEGKTKALRQWRFTSENEIDENLVASYIEEAIENHHEGKKIKPEKKSLEVPKELEMAFGQVKDLKVSFFSLTEGKQKEYAEYIGGAKREATRKSRLSKCIPMIQDGVGLNDQYKWKRPNPETWSFPVNTMKMHFKYIPHYQKIIEMNPIVINRIYSQRG